MVRQAIALITPMGLAVAQVAVPPLPSADSVRCASCAEWNAPRPPAHLFGNVYYVGTQGLSAVLVTSPQGHILLDGGLPESAARIRENIEALGFRIADVKLILNSHAHFDHAGGIAALQRMSGAKVMSRGEAAPVLRTGGALPSDPQFGLGLTRSPMGRRSRPGRSKSPRTRPGATCPAARAGPGVRVTAGIA
jgi:metallo-beta-lactamase class B